MPGIHDISAKIGWLIKRVKDLDRRVAELEAFLVPDGDGDEVEGSSD
jgi:hypothetical protein